jgi:serine/threonine protein kinase
LISKCQKYTYASHLYLYGEKIDLIKESKILNYNPPDISLLMANYEIEENKIYSTSLSPTEIYIAYEKKSGNKVAIKELKKEKLRDSFKLEMARNELILHNSISKLSSNVVKVTDYFEDEKSFYLITEFCEEANYFEDTLENRYCPISDEKTLKAFAFDILSALKEIHKNNIIHCDIKPQNFFLFKNENVNTSNNSQYTEDNYEDYFLKLTDFGFSHFIPEGKDKTFMKFPFGTFQYIAPEITKVIIFIK